MAKSITFAADESLIEEARATARALDSTLNEQFRLWLEEFARKGRAERARQTLADMQGKYSTGGRKFTREEMNERR